MECPLVSIIIPVYNGSNYMREAIDSALHQTYPNCEVIVVNDGSNDNGKTDGIARSYGNRIRYIIKENGGVSSAVNLGIKNMRGEYFSWLSHDDIYSLNKIEENMKLILSASDDVEICHSDFNLLFMENHQLECVSWLNHYSLKNLTDSCFAPLFLCINGSTVLVKRSCFERVGFYNENLPSTQDSEFLLKAMRGRKSLFCSRPLVTVREHADQNSRTMSFHEREFNETFTEFVKTLTPDEMREMCGSVFDFYYEMYIAMMGFNHSGNITKYLYNHMVETWHPDKDRRPHVSSVSGGVYIFGSGRYGKIMKAAFEAHGVEICAFLDNNNEKQDTRIDGIPCIKPEEILPFADTAHVMVAMLCDHEVIAQLEKYHCRHIYTQYEAYQWLDNYSICDIRKLNIKK